MKITKIDRSFLLGLHLFLNQMQLSLHRAKWIEFCGYVKSQFLLSDILHELNSHFSCDGIVLNTLEVPEIGFWQKLFIKNNSLYDVEQKFIMSCVVKLHSSLELSDEPDNEFISDLRLKLAYAAGIIQPRISEYREEYSRIDHFNQSEILQTKSLKELSGSSWPS